MPKTLIKSRSLLQSNTHTPLCVCVSMKLKDSCRGAILDKLVINTSHSAEVGVSFKCP